jgi:DNA modification methylase
MKIKTIADLIPDSRNARKHNPRNIGMIRESLGKVGAARSIVIDEEGNILAGNGTVEALADAGIEKVRVVETDGEEIVAVMRKGLTDKQKLELALADNRTAELAEWDSLVLEELNIEMPDVLEGLFFKEELDDIFNIDSPVGFLEGEDDVPERLDDTITKQGDIWKLGDHRLMCGDSTDKVTVDHLMDGQKADMVFTDPPYGIGYSGDKYKNNEVQAIAGSSKRNKAPVIIGDSSEFDPAFILDFFPDIVEIFIWGFQYYPQRLGRGGIIVWNKKQESQENCYHGDFELCWSKKQRNKMAWIKWGGFQSKESGEERLHTTQKPIKLSEWFFNKWSNQGDLVIDLFGGSGSTLIACEKLKRKCYMMEIDPAYCDVIVNRWENFTGLKAELC